jgi:hypothetical protein
MRRGDHNREIPTLSRMKELHSGPNQTPEFSNKSEAFGVFPHAKKL